MTTTGAALSIDQLLRRALQRFYLYSSPASTIVMACPSCEQLVVDTELHTSLILFVEAALAHECGK